jgi:hypothetical protein
MIGGTIQPQKSKKKNYASLAALGVKASQRDRPVMPLTNA